MELPLSEISRLLYELPAQIASKAKAAEEALKAQLICEAEYDRLRAGTFLAFKAENVGMTQKEIDSQVLQSEPVYQKRLDAINLECTARKLKCEVTELDDKFTGVKKLVSLREMEMRNLG